MKSFWIALAMYSKLPAKRVEWDKKSLSWALCWFPAVGVAAGALLFGWLWLQGRTQRLNELFGIMMEEETCR